MAPTESAIEFVHNQVKTQRIVVFSKSYCPYCKKAKSLLTQNNLQFTAHELDNMNQGEEIQDYLALISGQKTVPNIYINGKHLGGCDDLVSAFMNGKVEKMLQ